MFLSVSEETLKWAHSVKQKCSSILNVCCPYTSRDEITTSIRQAVSAARSGDLGVDEITPGYLYDHLSTQLCGSPDVDVLVRTSDVRRLSDFMMWQASPEIFFG